VEEEIQTRCSSLAAPWLPPPSPALVDVQRTPPAMARGSSDPLRHALQLYPIQFGSSCLMWTCASLPQTRVSVSESVSCFGVPGYPMVGLGRSIYNVEVQVVSRSRCWWSPFLQAPPPRQLPPPLFQPVHHPSRHPGPSL
jgi:hypothetical protein